MCVINHEENALNLERPAVDPQDCYTENAREARGGLGLEGVPSAVDAHPCRENCKIMAGHGGTKMRPLAGRVDA